MNVIDYVREEVSRQGHDVFSLDGIERVGWMLNAWSYALIAQGDPEDNHIDLHKIESLGQMIEKYKNMAGFRMCMVRVGMRIGPPAIEVEPRLKRLLETLPSMTPLEFYKEFEEIHPFVDGNGRTGKVLLNWLNGTLLNPIFPPAGLFGEPIRNP